VIAIITIIVDNTEEPSNLMPPATDKIFIMSISYQAKSATAKNMKDLLLR
jgi:hypothetical protein